MKVHEERACLAFLLLEYMILQCLGQDCGIACLCLHLWFTHAAKVPMRLLKKSDDLAKCKEITTMAWCQLSVKSCVEGFGYYGKIYFWPLSLRFSLFSVAAGLCLLSLLPSMFGPGGAANIGGHFDSRKMLESAIHALTIQVKCPQCTNVWSQQLKHKWETSYLYSSD